MTQARKSKRKGLFIVLEGIDGAGTTTQLRHVVEWLEKRGELAHATREPTDGPVGLLLRQILRGRLVSTAPGADGKPQPFDPAATALLFAADRLDHLHSEIVPALDAGRHVVCDRYVMSSLAYQSLETDLKFVRTINEKALAPDMTIFLRVRPEIAMDRIETTRTQKESFERLPLQKKIAAAYEKLLESWKDGEVAIVDGEENVTAVTTKVRAALERLF
ncbi:MAG: dTMP kinase [Deltaproteobacteria bacterium]|nr:dTMP kinase [Deltaproteobacteria bacterium]